jgi:hypothetical protein
MHTMVRALVSGAICICATSACRSSIGTPLPPRSGDVIPGSPAPESATRARLSGLRWTPTQHSLSIQVITEELSIGRRDTTRLLSAVVLRPDSTKRLLQAYLAPSISAPPPIAMDSLLVLELDANGIMTIQVPDSACITRSPFLSPLVIRSLFPRYSPTWPAVDTLSYLVCISAVPAFVHVKMQWDSPTLAPDSATRTQLIHLNGTVRADSTHVLPFSLAGSLSGAAEVTTDLQTSQIAQSNLTIHLSLIGTSALRRQQLTQTLIVTKLPR